MVYFQALFLDSIETIILFRIQVSGIIAITKGNGDSGIFRNMPCFIFTFPKSSPFTTRDVMVIGLALFRDTKNCVGRSP